MTFYGGRAMIFNVADYGAVPNIDTEDTRKNNQRAFITCINNAKANNMNAIYVPGGGIHYVLNLDEINSVATPTVNDKFNFVGDYSSQVYETRSKKIRMFDVWSTQVSMDAYYTLFNGMFATLNPKVDKLQTDVSELATEVSEIQSQVGSGENLSGRVQTLESEMDTAQSDINALKSSVASGKTAIASAITAKGVATASDSTFQTMASNIALIPSGSGVYTDDELVPVPDSVTFIGNSDFGTLPITYDNPFLSVKNNWYAFWQKVQGSTWDITTDYSGSGTPDKFVLYINDANGNKVDVVGFNVPERGTQWVLNFNFITRITSIFVDYTKRTITITAFQQNGGSGNNYYATKAIPANFDMKTLQLGIWVQKNSPKSTGSIGLQYQGRGVQTIT